MDDVKAFSVPAGRGPFAAGRQKTLAWNERYLEANVGEASLELLGYDQAKQVWLSRLQMFKIPADMARFAANLHV